MNKSELGQNIRYDPQAVAEARRRDLWGHINYCKEGIARAREQGDQGAIDLFTARKDEVRDSLRASFPRNNNGV